MPNRSPATAKSRTLYVIRASASPLMAASSTISSLGSRTCGLQSKCTSTGSINPASSARNSSTSSGTSPCASLCSGRFSTSSYSRKRGGVAKATSCRSATNRRTAFPAPKRVRSAATTTEVSRTILLISHTMSYLIRHRKRLLGKRAVVSMGKGSTSLRPANDPAIAANSVRTGYRRLVYSYIRY